MKTGTKIAAAGGAAAPVVVMHAPVLGPALTLLATPFVLAAAPIVVPSVACAFAAVVGYKAIKKKMGKNKGYSSKGGKNRFLSK